MKTKWKYHDIIDLEYFFQKDHDENSAELLQRDRHIFLEHAGSGEEDVPASQELLHIWLDARREACGNETAPLPGKVVSESHSLLRLLLLILGLALGSGSGIAYLNYSGTTPVNVLYFLVLFIFSQLLLTTILLIRGSICRFGAGGLPNSLPVRLAAGLATRLFSRLLKRSGMRMSAEKRLAMQAFLGRIRSANSLYANLAYWPLFLLVQFFGLCFNLGLLGATFLKISVSDLAFGWQSTLQFSGQSLHSVISWLALPWSWFIPEGTAYPTLAEIEGSRIILKEGIANLQTPDLISWWPFLLFSVLFYGVFVRIAAYGAGLFLQGKAYAALRFDTPAARQVVRRMSSPVVTTQAEPVIEPQMETETAEPEEPEAAIPAEQVTHPVYLLLPDEICDQCPIESINELLLNDGLNITGTSRFMVDYESDLKLLEELGNHKWNDSASIMIFMEAWMPPLVSFQSFLRELRQRTGSVPILVRLLGKPDAATALTPVDDDTQLQVWQQKMDSLGDPYLNTAVLMENDTQ